jgi:cytochrome c551
MRLLFAGALLVVSACSVGRPAPDATGEEIYIQLCSNCHGDDLSGGIGPALGPGSEAAERPEAFLESAIMDGRGRMPSFESSLDEDQLGRLIGFIREEQRR